MRMLSILRWMLVIPTAFVGWYAGLMVAMLIYKTNEALCSTRYFVSGVCGAPWSSFVENVAILIGGGVVGALVVLLPSLMAPHHRRQVAFIAYGLGLACSIFMLSLMLALWGAVLCAALAGGLMVWRLNFSPASSVDSKVKV